MLESRLRAALEPLKNRLRVSSNIKGLKPKEPVKNRLKNRLQH